LLTWVSGHTPWTKLPRLQPPFCQGRTEPHDKTPYRSKPPAVKVWRYAVTMSITTKF